MRLFLYYALHSFVNQLRKLFKTWVLIFLLACMLLGGLIGLGALGVLPPAASALLHNGSTVLLSANSMTPVLRDGGR